MKNFNTLTSKISLILLMCIAFSISIVSCKPHQDPEQHADGITDKDIQAMKDAHLITLEEAVKAHKKYGKDRVKILKDTLKEKYKDKDFKDTRNVWVEIKTLKAYIHYIETYASDAEGLQFYFSVNSDKATGKKKNHQSFFIAPTVQNVIDGETIQSGFTVKNGKRVFLYEEFKKYLEETEARAQKAGFLSSMPPPNDDDGYLFNRNGGSPPDGDN